MIERIIEYSVRNPFVVVFFALVVAGFGVYAVLNTPVDAIPDLSENQVIVFADWPGRSPREVEDQVTYPLSVNLQGLAGIKAIRATSEFGFSMINIIFDDHIDFYFARQRVLERLSTASTFLPDGVVPYMAPDATALGQIFWYTVEGDGYDLGRLRAIQDWYVRYQLASVSGVAEVASVGGFPIEYQIDVDPDKLRAYGVTLGEVFSAVERSNSSVGGRVVQKANSEYLVRSVGWIRSLDDVRNIVIKSIGGTPVFVSNVATVQLGSALRRASLEKNGNEAVGGVVLMRYGENPLEVTKRIKEKIEQLQAGLPPGVRIVPFYERTALIERAIGTVTETLAQELVICSVMIMFIMWHFRSALLVCLTLPLAVLVSFIFMRWIGVPSNIMSLAGLAISIGVLEDSSVVMVDNATHRLYARFGKTPVTGDIRELVLPAMQTVGRPIFFSVMIMLISFIPVFALGGMEGRMFHPLAWTKTFALIGVAILAITFVPALVPLLIRGRLHSEDDSWLVRSVAEIYRPVMRFLLDHPWPIVLVTGVIFVCGAAPLGVTVVFQAVLLFTLVATIWFVANDEPGFGNRWPIVAGFWIAILSPFLLRLATALFDHLFGTRVSHFLPSIGSWRFWDWGFGDLIQWMSWLLFYVVSLVIFLMPILVLVALLAWMSLLGRATMFVSLVLVALLAFTGMTPLGREFMPDLDEGTILDMPVTIPRASITQVADDLKARDALLRSFPEVESVVGKAGRAETPTDPAPPDMVETIVNLRSREHWPKRELRYDDASLQTEDILDALVERSWIKKPTPQQYIDLVNDATMFAIEAFDKAAREMAFHDYAQFEHDLGPELLRYAVDESVRLLRNQGKLLREPTDEDVTVIAEAMPQDLGAQLAESPDLPTVTRLAQTVADEAAKRSLVKSGPDLFLLNPGIVRRLAREAGEILGRKRPTLFSKLLDAVEAERDYRWTEHVKQFNWQLFDHIVPYYTQEATRELLTKAAALKLADTKAPVSDWSQFNADLAELNSDRPYLWKKTKAGLEKEFETVIQVPGWGNIWTQPIINRVNMLATGVRTMIGVKVYGDDLNKIQQLSQEIAAILKQVPGAVGIVPDQIVGEGYLEIDIDREKAARYGVNVGDIQDVVETALGGKTITTVVDGRERFPVRIRYARAFREDEESVKNLLISMSERTDAPSGMSTPANEFATSDSLDPFAAGATQIPLSMVADVRIVEGPSMIKSENGLLRAYVQLNVRDRDIVGFVEEAQRAVAEKVNMPEGMYVEWSGQFEHQVRARKTLMIIMPIVIAIIFVLLYITYHDFVDAMLMMLAVPGAVAGGVLFQYFFGFNFSVAVWVGFIACFGLATETGVVMLVYLREAVENRGGLEKIASLAELKQAIMDGAVHRLRPKLLTEGTTIIGLAPMLWATGTGAEIMRPMAAPVLGGLLVADEVIDLLLPVLFYHVRARRWRKLHARETTKQSLAA